MVWTAEQKRADRLQKAIKKGRVYTTTLRTQDAQRPKQLKAEDFTEPSPADVLQRLEQKSMELEDYREEPMALPPFAVGDHVKIRPEFRTVYGINKDMQRVHFKLKEYITKTDWAGWNIEVLSGEFKGRCYYTLFPNAALVKA